MHSAATKVDPDRPQVLRSSQKDLLLSPEDGTIPDQLMSLNGTAWSRFLALRARLRPVATASLICLLSTAASLRGQTLSVRLMEGASTYVPPSGSVLAAQLFSAGGTYVTAVNQANPSSVSFGTQPYGTYRVDWYQGGILVSQQSISFSSGSSLPIQVSVRTRRTLAVTAVYNDGVTRVPSGWTVRVWDLAPVAVATGSTNASGQVTFTNVFPTDLSGSNRYTVRLYNTSGTDVGNATGVAVANSSTASTVTLWSTLTPSGGLSVRLMEGASTYVPPSGSVLAAQLFSAGGTYVTAVNQANPSSVSFGTQPYGTYRVDWYQGGILVSQQSISFSSGSSLPIQVSVRTRRTLAVTAVYNDGVTRVPSGWTVRVWDLAPVAVATGSTNASGQVTFTNVFPTDLSGSNRYTVRLYTRVGRTSGTRQGWRSRIRRPPAP